MPPKYPPRDSFLTKEEIAKLLDSSKKIAHLELFILIALATGARRGAILGLTWDRVNFNKRVIDFNDPNLPLSKKRRPVVPFAEHLFQKLSLAHSVAQTTYVIEWAGKPLKRIDRTLNNAAARAGIKCTSHILKHTAISYMAEMGIPVSKIAEYTQTTHQTVERVYLKVNPESLRPIAEEMDALFATTSSNSEK